MKEFSPAHAHKYAIDPDPTIHGATGTLLVQQVYSVVNSCHRANQEVASYDLDRDASQAIRYGRKARSTEKP